MFNNALLDGLPLNSRIKFEQLAADRDVAYLAFRNAREKEFELIDDLTRLKVIQTKPGIQSSYPALQLSDDQTIIAKDVAPESPLGLTQARLARAREAVKKAGVRLEETSVVQEIESWLDRTVRPGMRFEPITVKVPKGMRALPDIAKIRAQIENIDVEWEKVSCAPLPADEFLSRLHDEIDSVASIGAPRLSPNSRSYTPLNLESGLSLGVREGNSGHQITGNAGAPLFLWLTKDLLKDQVSSMVKGINFEGSLTDEQREEAFAKLSFDKLELERLEEALICHAELDGQLIPRRRYADPRAILGIHI